MTERLRPSSPRLAAAVKFGELLTRTMAAREVGQRVVRDAAGVSRASVVEFRNGRNLPTLEVALRISEALGEPRMAEIVRGARTFACLRCSRPVLNEKGFPKRYCSASCRALYAGERRRADQTQAVMILRGELLRVGPVRKQQVGRALTMLDDAARPAVDALAAVDAYQDAVSAMCASCEPDGLCRTPECSLRGVSPLPLATSDVEVTTARKPAGLWATPGMREHMAGKMRQVWARDPARRQRQAEANRRRWADADREETGRKISEGRRKGAAA